MVVVIVGVVVVIVGVVVGGTGCTPCLRYYLGTGSESQVRQVVHKGSTPTTLVHQAAELGGMESSHSCLGCPSLHFQ